MGDVVALYEIALVVDASEVDYSAGVRAWTGDGRWFRRLSLQAEWSGYTLVTVKLQARLGDTWSDISGFSITTSGDIVSGQIGPYKEIAVHITATLSAGADTMKVWVCRG